MTIDLHIHTNASDGNIDPKKVLEIAAKNGLKTIAFADHETTAGYEEVKNLAVTNEIQLIPAVELQTWYNGKEVHILGYYVDVDDRSFQKELISLRNKRNQCAKNMVDKISSYGYSISWEQVVALSHVDGPVSKGHIMQALKQKGYIKSKEDAYHLLGLYLNQNGKAYSCHEFSSVEAIKLIKRAKGIPVLAHPGLINNDEIVAQLIDFGVEGLEVYYYYFGNHRAELIEKYRKMALDNNLLMTGGSDYHGTITPVVLGELVVPKEVRCRIMQYAKKL